MQITSSSPCPGHLRSQGWGDLKDIDAGTHAEREQHREEPERWGDNFQQMCPRDLVTSVLYLLPGVSEAEGGVCKSVSLAAIIQPFPHLSPSLEYSLSSQGTLSPVCAVLSILLSIPEPSRKSGAYVCCEG